MIRCENCRQDNVFLDFDAPLATADDILKGMSHPEKFELSPFWYNEGYVLMTGVWYCHLCNFFMRFPHSWITL